MRALLLAAGLLVSLAFVLEGCSEQSSQPAPPDSAQQASSAAQLAAASTNVGPAENTSNQYSPEHDRQDPYPTLADSKAIAGSSVTTPALASNDVEANRRADRAARAAVGLALLLFPEAGGLEEGSLAARGVGAEADLAASGSRGELGGQGILSARGALAEAAPEIRLTLERIEQGGPFPFSQDGAVFENIEGRLPRDRSYREYTVQTPNAPDRGARRIVIDQNSGSIYYTPDHYNTFILVR